MHSGPWAFARPIVVLGLISISAFSAPPVFASSEAALPLIELPHIHAIEFDAADASLLIATHQGIFRFSSGAPAIRITNDLSDYMAMAVTTGGALIASGHPEAGGNLGVLRSEKPGGPWVKLSEGADGPVDFHSLAVSSANQQQLVAVNQGGLQVSSDGGKTWQWKGELPPRSIDLALSADGRTIYAATIDGVRISVDDGGSWQPLPGDIPTTTTAIATFGDELFAYALGQGLLVRRLGEAQWSVRAADMGEIVLQHLAQDPTNKERIIAAATGGIVLESLDSGASWSPLE